MSQAQNMPVHIDSEKMLEPFPEKEREVAGLLPFTVVLMTPDYLANQYGEDTSTCHVFAEERIRAVMAARTKAQETLDALEHNPDDFAVIFVCHGHQANIAP